jgi:hypothetical protein
LQTPVRRQAADRVLDDLEIAGLERDPVEHDGPVDDPADRKETESRTIDGGAHGEVDGHPVDADGDDCRSRKAEDRRDPCGLAQHADQEQQHEDRQRGCERGKDKAIRQRDVLLLPHASGLFQKMP